MHRSGAEANVQGQRRGPSGIWVSAEAGQGHQGQAVGQQEEILPLADAPLIEAGQASSASTGQPGQPNLPRQQGAAGQQLNRDHSGASISEVVRVQVKDHGILGQPACHGQVS